MTGAGHPLPGSDEARHNEIPEHLAREKGRGDDSKPVVQPEDDPVTPDGEPYRYDDLGRGPAAAEQHDMAGDRPEGRSAGLSRDQKQDGDHTLSAGDDLAEDQAAHQDRGQAIAESESGRD